MIKNYLQSFNILTDEEIENLIQFSIKKVLTKSDYFIQEGETCKKVAFVMTGIFRSYYISDKGEEITYCITFPNNFMTAYSSFITGQGTNENIQALTQVELLIIPKKEIDNLVAKNPNWVKFLKRIAELQYIELEKRVFQLQKYSASRRYAELINNQPEYIENIPLHYLASYLGISQRHLSRIRKKNSF